jgi:hypothetical protein
MTLDYEAIRKMTKERSAVKKEEAPLTEKELKRVQYYIEDIEYNIVGLAEAGKDKFTYDCSKLTQKMFQELAVRFKNKNPLFYVTTNSGTQLLTVEWHGKNEA